MPDRIAVIGAGISGLTTAYHLRHRGFTVQVFEANDQVGGPIATRSIDGYRIETGPHTLLVRHAAVERLIQDLGLGDEVTVANEEAKKRFVVRHGKPIALPMSPADFATTELLSPAARLRLLAEPFMPANRPPDDIDETLASFIARRLGEEALAYLLDPFVGGIFAGNPYQLSAHHSFPTLVAFEKEHGSIALGALKERLLGTSSDERVQRRLISFQDGMAALVKSLAAQMEDDLHLSSTVREVRQLDEDWELIFDWEDSRRSERFDALVVTVPTHRLRSIDWSQTTLSSSLLREVATLPYAPCTVVSTGFDKTQLDHPLDGFGALVPAVENRHILGSLFVSTMFDGRAPQGKVNLTTFVGGARQPQLARRSDADILQLVRQDLGRLLGLRGEPEMTHITRWDKAIPQYEVGHQYYLDRFEALESATNGLFFAGNFKDGIGVPDLIVESEEKAHQIEEALS